MGSRIRIGRIRGSRWGERLGGGNVATHRGPFTIATRYRERAFEKDSRLMTSITMVVCHSANSLPPAVPS